MMKSLSSNSSKSYTFLKLGRILACFFFIYCSVIVFAKTNTDFDSKSKFFIESKDVFYASNDVVIISTDSIEMSKVEAKIIEDKSKKEIITEDDSTHEIKKIFHSTKNPILVQTSPSSQRATNSFESQLKGVSFQTSTNHLATIPSLLRSIIYFVYPLDSNWKYTRNQKRGLLSLKYFSRPPPSFNFSYNKKA